jgi:hypothetical protein
MLNNVNYFVLINNIIYLSSMKNIGIYILRSKAEPSLFYIGASKNIKRRKYYWSGNNINRYYYYPGIFGHLKIFGLNDLEFKVLEYCSEYNLCQREQYWISELNPCLNTYKFSSSAEGSVKAKQLLVHDPEFINEYIRKEKQLLEYLNIENTIL